MRRTPVNFTERSFSSPAEASISEEDRASVWLPVQTNSISLRVSCDAAWPSAGAFRRRSGATEEETSFCVLCIFISVIGAPEIVTDFETAGVCFVSGEWVPSLSERIVRSVDVCACVIP